MMLNKASRNTMRSLGEVAEEINRMSSNCHDEKVPVSEIRFRSLDSMRIGSSEHNLRTVAQREIANRLSVPYSYLRRCPEDIQAMNLNHWIEQERNRELFIRFDGDDVRAVFTPRYVPVDNHTILNKIISMGYEDSTKVQLHLDSEFLLLNFPNRDEPFAIFGDEMQSGVSISNSEVGLSSFGIASYVYRLICTNGLISATNVEVRRFRHVSHDVIERLPESMQRVKRNFVSNRMQLINARNRRVQDIEETFERFNKSYQLSDLEQEAVVWAWEEEFGETMFNIIQSYTRAAQYNALSAESSYRLQKVGGAILSLMN